MQLWGTSRYYPVIHQEELGKTIKKHFSQGIWGRNKNLNHACQPHTHTAAALKKRQQIKNTQYGTENQFQFQKLTSVFHLIIEHHS